MKRRLTEMSVAKLKPTPGKQIVYQDSVQAGLIMRVNWSGTKSWRVLYYVDRKTRSYGLGHFPDVGVKRARELAGEFRANLKSWLADKSKPSPVAKESFKQIAESYLKREVENKLRSESQIRAILKNSIYPTWADRPFEEMRRGDVTRLLDTIADSRGPRAADIALALVRRIMGWYQSRVDDYTSPVVKGMSRSKPKERARKRILTDDEIRAMWKACKQLGTFGAFVKVLLLTAQRRSKVSTMRFEDIVGDTWVIASVAREKGNAERLILPPIVLSIIEQQRKLSINEFIFPAIRRLRRDNPNAHDGSFSSFAKSKADLDRLMKKQLPDMQPWVLHDLRRTAKSCMSRTDVRPDISERVLGHSISGIEGIYDQHNYDEQRGNALAALVTLIERILEPPDSKNVVKLPIRKGR